ncbi:MAG: hypothetical protein Q8P20_00330 [bacterium]|nr:hypothetical protein [bacterium]
MPDENFYEIERRWIIKDIPSRTLINRSTRRKVGYIFNSDSELRLVKAFNPTITTNYISIKTDGGLVRKEWQERIPDWAFDAAWPQTVNNRLEITRHFINDNNNLLEIDEYHGRFKGLIKLEVEFTEVETSIGYKLPIFIKAHVDVTNDNRFNNKNLARLKPIHAQQLVKAIQTQQKLLERTVK